MEIENKIKVLIVDHDRQLARRLSDYIRRHGFDTDHTYSFRETRSKVLSWHPQVIICDVMLTDGNAYDILDFLKTDPAAKVNFTTFMVMSSHNSQANVQQALDRGVNDYVCKPFQFEDMVKRLVFNCRSFRRLQELNQRDYQTIDDNSLMMHLTNLVLRQALTGRDLERTLFNLTRMLTMKMDGVRCSIVDCIEENTGVVVTSNDNKEASGIVLDLGKYPEIKHVRNTRMTIAIEDLQQDRHLKYIKKFLSDIQFNSMVVCPVSRGRDFFGVLSLKLPDSKTVLTDNELRFIETVAHVVSLVLSDENYADKQNYWREKSKTLRVI